MSEGSRLALRPFEDGDTEAVMNLHRNPRVRQMLVDDHPLDEPAQAARFVELIQHFYRAHPGLGIWHASDASGFVGWFSLMPAAGHPGDVELGSRLLPRAWGTGLAMEGCELLLRRAFEVRPQCHVRAACHPANRGARMCLLAMGMRSLGMGPYEGGTALHHGVEITRWQGWMTQTRQVRLRQAALTLRQVATAADHHGARHQRVPADRHAA